MGHHSNDSHNLAGHWFDVPPEAVRPQSAIEYDQRGGVQKDMNFQQQRQFWEDKNKKFKALGESRKNRKRQDTRSEPAK